MNFPGRSWTFCLLVACLVGCTPPDPGKLTLVDETRRLQKDLLLVAAEPIVQRGAHVVIFFLEKGEEQDVERRLQGAGLWRDGDIAARGICIYVSLRPRYSDLRAGSRWSDLLTSPTLEGIRGQTVNPGLRSGGYQKAAEDCLRQLSLKMEMGISRQRRWREGLFLVLASGLLLWAFSRTRLAGWLWSLTPRARREENHVLLRARANVRVRVKELRALAARHKGWEAQLTDALFKTEDLEVCNLAELKALSDKIGGLTKTLRNLEASQTACRSRSGEVRQILQGIRPHRLAEEKDWLARLAALDRATADTTEVADLNRIKADLRTLYAEISDLWKIRFPSSWEQRFQSTARVADLDIAADSPERLTPCEPSSDLHLPEHTPESSRAAGDW